jgi:integrase
LAFPSAKLTRTVRFFSAEQVTRIIGAAKEEPYRTMFVVAALTGLRAGEICGLSVDDLDFERRSIHISRSAWYGKLQTPKSRSAVRTIPVPDILSAVLRSYLRVWIPNPSRLLFATKTGLPHSANKVVQRKLWPILDALEIPQCGFHAFRHTASTLLVDAGAPVTVTQAQLGHSDPRTTLGIYSHVVPESQRSAMDKLARILMPDDATQEGTGKWVQ